jgi:hypothetical protein
MLASPPELAPSAIANIVFGEADPPTKLSRTSVFGERKESRIIGCGDRLAEALAAASA